MIDARSYRASDTLRDGTPVTVRAIRPGDWRAVLSAFQDLDPESVYARFFTYKKTLADDELRRITDVDFDQVVALVVMMQDADEDVLMGGGRYAVGEDTRLPTSAEVAFMTSDHCRGRGVASLLLNHLVRIGRSQGLSRFEALVLPHNHAMLAVLRRCGLPMTSEFDDGVVRVSLTLAEGA